MRLGIVVSRYNQNITQGLLEGALRTFKNHGIKFFPKDILWVPGAYEIPLAVKALALSKRYDALIALGCVLKGETSHNQYISEAAARGILEISLETMIPISFRILTPDTMRQALERSGKGSANKGTEAAEAAVEMARTLRLRKG